MNLPNIFEPTTTAQNLARLDNLSADTQPQWGKMNAAQMLAHLNVAYDVAYGKKEVKVSGFARFLLKTFLKPMVTTNKKPYMKNGRTADYFIVADQRDFDAEKAKLVNYVKQIESDGVAMFEGKKSVSFGEMTANEWSVQFQKHMDHHFRQFGI